MNLTLIVIYPGIYGVLYFIFFFCVFAAAAAASFAPLERAINVRLFTDHQKIGCSETHSRELFSFAC